VLVVIFDIVLKKFCGTRGTHRPSRRSLSNGHGSGWPKKQRPADYDEVSPVEGVSRWIQALPQRPSRRRSTDYLAPRRIVLFETPAVVLGIWQAAQWSSISAEATEGILRREIELSVCSGCLHC